MTQIQIAQAICRAVMAGDDALVASLITSLSVATSAPSKMCYAAARVTPDFDDEGRPQMWGNA